MGSLESLSFSSPSFSFIQKGRFLGDDFLGESLALIGDVLLDKLGFSFLDSREEIFGDDFFGESLIMIGDMLLDKLGFSF